MEARCRRSRMALVQMLLFLAVPGVGALLSIKPNVCKQSSPTRPSTELFSETTLSPPKDAIRKTTASDSSTRKRLGKSSFLYKQQPSNEGGRTTSTSPDELRLLAEEHSGKIVGSFQYKKASTQWLYLAVESIRQDLGERLLQRHSNNDETSADETVDEEIREATEKLFFDLGVAADVGTMPSFESEAARKGYALEFFCRGRALAELLLETPLEEALDDKYPRFWTRSLRSPDCPLLGGASEATTEETSDCYEIVSLASGPGFDFVGLALAAAFSFHTSRSTAAFSPRSSIHITAMDYEEGWGDLVSAMDRSITNILTPLTTEESGLPAMSCDWGGKCDITKSILHEPVNANCRRLLLGDDNGVSASRLWICQYCVAENAKALRDSDYLFLKELVAEMREGTLVLLTEVVPRLWPEMVRMLHREGLLDLVDIGFRKNGRQFLLKKKDGTTSIRGKAVSKHDDDDAFSSLDEKTRVQLEHFEKLASYHKRKVDSGWKRQGRTKIV